VDDVVSLDEGEVTIKQREDIQVTVLRKAAEPQYAEPSR
jgi:hypothetical protein